MWRWGYRPGGGRRDWLGVVLRAWDQGEGSQTGRDEDDGRADTSERGHVTILR